MILNKHKKESDMNPETRKKETETVKELFSIIPPDYEVIEQKLKERFGSETLITLHMEPVKPTPQA